MLVFLAVICSCQKQDSTVEAQLAQRKAELDSREQALDEREKALERKQQALADRQTAVPNSRIIQPRPKSQAAAEVEADRQRRIQQLPPELRALIPSPNAARVQAERAEKERAIAGSAADTPDSGEISPSPSPTP